MSTYPSPQYSELSSHEKTCKKPKHKDLVGKGYMLYDSSYTTFWERQNYGDIKTLVASE